ncbi:MAG: protein jag [Lachnospiraceae bacterium]|nr:protein jag [Lachnospiraceae bacterium]
MEDWKEYTGKSVEEALETALADMGTTSDKVIYEVVEEASSGFLGLNKKPAIIKVALKEIDPCECVVKFIKEVLAAMGLNAEVEASMNEEKDTIDVQINGEDMGILIGKRGQTLDSLQYLASLAVSREAQNYFKVKLDTENYRARRKETLENLAKNIGTRVKKTHKLVALEPMNPYERRIIHSTLQNDTYVETHSEGEEPYRKVIITPKKGVYYENKRGGRFGGNGKRGGYGNGRGGYGNGAPKKISSREFHKKYGADTKDYSTDYKKDYADYLESKAAAKVAAMNKEAGSTDSGNSEN